MNPNPKVVRALQLLQSSQAAEPGKESTDGEMLLHHVTRVLELAGNMEGALLLVSQLFVSAVNPGIQDVGREISDLSAACNGFSKTQES